MANEKDNVSSYLDYLDKEMTIMGILSTFCIVSLGFATDRLILSDNENLRTFWIDTPYLVSNSLLGLLISALLFYRERALLAWYYGQISLYKAKADDGQVQKLLDNSDGWNNWVYYQMGFGFLFMAISELGCILLSNKFYGIKENEIAICIVIFSFWFIIYLFKTISYKKFHDKDKPEKELCKAIFGVKGKTENAKK